ncbi:hypothetical protein [Agromyces sp. ZXT2-3]|uniref:hypothetical protein n=1 Tax=Agromyces sp. ZXT2-3 TaxID=3461152 RepID=UPI004054A9C5
MNGYAIGQLSNAFLTATTHEDPDVRRRADNRAARWSHAISAMANADVMVGSRTPVSGLPAWVTLEVLRGGFATGNAVAAGPIAADEIAEARRLGLDPARRLLFGHYLTDAGLKELYELLDSGTYTVEVPEDAALLTVAWLVRSGDRAGALELLEAIAPYSEKLRFAPKRAAATQSPPDHVFRLSAGDARQALVSRRDRERVETQREALAVWNPLADRVLTHMLELLDGQRLNTRPATDWLSDAASILAEYDRLATVHTRCTKHRRPKDNLAILLASTRDLVEGRTLSSRRLGLLHHVITSMVAKRGIPGSSEHAAVRAAQNQVAATPSHAQLARLASSRLEGLDPMRGIANPSAFSLPVGPSEAAASGIPGGSPMPPVVDRVLARAHSAPVEQLVSEGVIPSAEVLADLVPQISGTVVASTFGDPALARLSAANYRAFRRRRSLLLVNLEKQVQLTELPWVKVTLGHGRGAADEATAVLRRVGALALDAFPATILPNPLIQELQQLMATAGRDIPLVEELAADIFMGRFSDKFRRSAQVAARTLSGSLYERYYAIDWAQIVALAEPTQPSTRPRRAWSRPDWPRARVQPPIGPTFGDLCFARAGAATHDRWSVAHNGAVIEQAQILTTHNLAALVEAGILPTHPWDALASAAFERVARLLALAGQQHRPLATIKDAAYAWRQAVFYLSLVSTHEMLEAVSAARHAHGSSLAMSTLLDGLRLAAVGDRGSDSRMFLGWTTTRHWILDLLPSRMSVAGSAVSD